MSIKLDFIESQETYFQLYNNTFWNIVKTDIKYNENDWDGVSNPYNNLRNRKLTARGDFLREREEVKNHGSNSLFTIALHFSDGTKDEFQINQKHAIGEPHEFIHKIKSHDIYFQRSGDKTLVVKVKNTALQEDEEAISKNKEAEEKMMENQYEAAMKILDEALKLAKQDSTINSIKNNKSKNLDLINFKIEGNRLFNEGKEIEKEACDLTENAEKSEVDYEAIKIKYEEAKNKYEEGTKKFEEGRKIDERFEDATLTKAVEAVEKVKGKITNISCKQLEHIIMLTNEKEEKQKPEKVDNENLQMIVTVEQFCK